MKQLKLLLSTFLTFMLGFIPIMAQDTKKCVMIETDQGVKMEYYISANPRFVQDNDKVTLSSDATTVELTTDQIKKVYLSEANYKLEYMLDGEVFKTYYHHEGISITSEPSPQKEGHVFSGWTNEPAVMPANDVICTGFFTVSSFKLTYKVDGEVYKTYDVKYGETITPEVDPQKEGYTFSGWSEIPSMMPAQDIIINGSFTINKYKLTYIVDGESYKADDVSYGETIKAEPAPEKEGYVFSGWSEIPSTMPAHDVTITGTFTKGQYNVTYLVDGEVFKTFKCYYGDAITPEPQPTKEGYTFSGWSEVPETMPAKDVTIKGSFSINKYKLIYLVDSKIYRTYDIEYGAIITPEPQPTKEGYTFSGWSEIPKTMPAHDVTIEGSFSKGSFTLTYMLDGEVYKTVKYDYGDAITPEPVPTKEGYTFSGWSDIPEAMPAHDVTVKGTFTVNKYKLTYMVDGEVYKSYEMEYGTTITPEIEPSKDGNTFSGWSWIPTKMPAEDVTVNGSFTKNEYTLTYLVDDAVYKTIKCKYGDTITPESAPTKEGHSFSGWSDIPTTMPAHDVTIKGSFAINQYKLTYMVDGENYKSYEIEYGASITPEKEPTKEGYTFSGWGWIPSKMPAEDVIISGTFTVNKYTITYEIDGNVFMTEQVEFGAKIIPPSISERQGYAFAWGEYPSTMPAHDITITGKYTTGIGGISIRQGDVNAGEEYVCLSGLTPNESVIVFNLKGEKVRHLHASPIGDLTISLSMLNSGVYIIKTNYQTFKVTRK